MYHSTSDLLFFWNLTKSIGAKRIKYEDFNDIHREKNDVFGIKRTGSVLYLVFAGSNDLKDWIRNLKIMKLPENRDVHDGFYHSAKALRCHVKKYINMHGNIQTIICIGHSAGGAIAEEINRYNVKYLGRSSCAVTFGSPKIGGEEYYNESLGHGLTVDRYEYPIDLVPKSPPFNDWYKYGEIHMLPQPWYFIMSFLGIFAHTHYKYGLTNFRY